MDRYNSIMKYWGLLLVEPFNKLQYFSGGWSSLKFVLGGVRMVFLLLLVFRFSCPNTLSPLAQFKMSKHHEHFTSIHNPMEPFLLFTNIN